MTQNAEERYSPEMRRIIDRTSAELSDLIEWEYTDQGRPTCRLVNPSIGAQRPRGRSLDVISWESNNKPHLLRDNLHTRSSAEIDAATLAAIELFRLELIQTCGAEREDVDLEDSQNKDPIWLLMHTFVRVETEVVADNIEAFVNALKRLVERLQC